MEVNVRDDTEGGSVEAIVFGVEGEFITVTTGADETLELFDPASESSTPFYKEDIDFLIKALERAKKEWT